MKKLDLPWVEDWWRAAQKGEPKKLAERVHLSFTVRITRGRFLSIGWYR